MWFSEKFHVHFSVYPVCLREPEVEKPFTAGAASQAESTLVSALAHAAHAVHTWSAGSTSACTSASSAWPCVSGAAAGQVVLCLLLSHGGAASWSSCGGWTWAQRLAGAQCCRFPVLRRLHCPSEPSPEGGGTGSVLQVRRLEPGERVVYPCCSQE